MNKSKQQGSVHVAIIIILILAILGLLGYVFWQNFINKKEDLSNQTSSTSAETTKPEDTTKELKKLTINKGVGVDFSFSYPKDWSVERSYHEGSGRPSESVNLESPSGKFSVYYLVGPGGVGGACNPDLAGKVGYVHSENIPGLSVASFSEIILKLGDKYGLTMAGAISKRSSLPDVKVGDSGCRTYLIHFVDLKEPWTGQLIMNAKIGIDGGGSNSSYDSIEEITNIFNEKEYKEAKAIILSTVYKE